MRALALVGGACAGAAVGLIAEHEAYEWSDLRGWVPDLFAGWTLIAVGLALVALRRSWRASALLLVAGISWFAFDFATTGPEVGWVAERTAYIHRAALFTLALALPAGRPRTDRALVGIALAWLAAVVWPVWDYDVAALVAVAALLVIAVDTRRSASGWRERATASIGLACVGLLCSAIAADAVRSIIGADQDVADATVIAYAVAVAVTGVGLLMGVLLDAPASLAERAVALERGGARLRDALRDLLGDPQLAIGFGPDGVAPVDDTGRPLRPPPAADVATPVVVSGRRVGVVFHAPSTLDDPATRSAVLATVGLGAERARLRAEVDRQIDAVAASRRRLLRAEEEERRRIAGRLDRGPGAALAGVEQLVRDTRTADGASGQLAEALDRATEQLRRVRPEIDSLVRGLSVADEHELHSALRQLASDLPLAVELDVVDAPLPAEVASALWFVCAEALSNAVKHASASTVRVSLSATGATARLEIVDDGSGGAEPRGSGLVGLSDRVGALGGRLSVESPPGEGTTLVADVPLWTST
jgi:signal transduction histidine kinase